MLGFSLKNCIVTLTKAAEIFKELFLCFQGYSSVDLIDIPTYILPISFARFYSYFVCVCV